MPPTGTLGLKGFLRKTQNFFVFALPLTRMFLLDDVHCYPDSHSFIFFRAMQATAYVSYFLVYKNCTGL